MDDFMYGTIALDIDGTLTADSRLHTMPAAVIKYLAGLERLGWKLMFITGRTFQASYKVLENIPFSYHLAVQNGAVILEMPSRKIVSKRCLDRSIFTSMAAICQDEPSDFAIYTGVENQDVCYYRPKYFSPLMLKYLEERIACFKETWYGVDSYDEMDIHEFPSVKCFGLYDSAAKLAHKIETTLGLHVPLIRDPFDENYYVVQATHAKVNKGQALKDLLALTGHIGKIIAAGDDHNDCPLLAAADIKIAMATAPEELLKMADIIAPPASEMGIIKALEEAVKK